MFGRWQREAVVSALLAAYEDASAQVGTRLYLPVRVVRAALRPRLPGRRPTRAELDEVLRAAPALLPEHVVRFSPFSGPVPPSAGGLAWTDPLGRPALAGFLSVRPAEGAPAVRPSAARGSRGRPSGR